MINIPAEIIHFVLLPILSAQLLLVVLIYFSLVSRRVLKGFPFHVCYLLSYAFYLAGKTLQNYADVETQMDILFLRVAVLFSFGIPSMAIATSLQVGASMGKKLRVLHYLLGVIASVFYVVVVDAYSYNGLIPRVLVALLPFHPTTRIAEWFMFSYILCALIAPCLLLLSRQLQQRNNPVSLTFLSGTICFGLFHIATFLVQEVYHFGILQLSSSLLKDVYWLLYIGALATAWCWCFAVFQDINYTKGRAELLKEQLQYLVRSGGAGSKSEVDSILAQLEETAGGNLDLYKLKVREAIDRLTNLGIEAGGDVDVLLARNAEKNKAIEISRSAKSVQEIVSNEVLEFSGMIAKLPADRASAIAEKTLQYISENYHNTIDVASIAEQFDVSQSYLMRVFKKATGQTLNQNLVATRIEHAKRLLLEDSVTNTAFSVGFNSSNYFSTAFKKATGISPAQYQNTHQPKN